MTFAAIDYALAYARLGWPVLPVRPRDKRPLNGNGIDHASTDPARLHEWFDAAPDANIGIRLDAAGLLALDFDPRNGADLAECDDLPATLTATTGGGGRHLLYRAPPGVALPGKLHAGVDVKHRGYIIVEPSRHPSGGAYQWLDWSPLDDGPPELADIDLRDLLGEHADQAPPKSDAPGAEASGAVPPGGRNDFLSREAYRLRKLGLSVDQIMPVLLALNANACTPPLTEAEVRAIAEGKRGIPADESRDDGLRVETAGAFVRAFDPPVFTIEPVIARGHLVALTAHPNGGKSSIAVQLALAQSGKARLPGLEAVPQRVLYLIGENDHNLRGQFLAACQQHGLDPAAASDLIDFLPRRLSIAENAIGLADLAQQRGGYGLVIVDTRIAYSDSLDENDNAQAHKDASALRDLTRIEGTPAVLVLCHPPKLALRDGLVPRGGSSFYGEIDENVTLWADGDDVTMQVDKRRIPDFPPIAWRMQTVDLAGVVDHKGRPIRSVIAYRVSDVQQDAAASQRRADENRLLAAMVDAPNGSLATWAGACGWLDPAGGPQKWKAQRVVERLAEHKLARRYRERWVLTAAGRDEARGTE